MIHFNRDVFVGVEKRLIQEISQLELGVVIDNVKLLWIRMESLGFTCVHTASSYDYKYKGDDADDLLCQILIQNDIKAVAITDHFKIDKNRIESLCAKAPGIVFFPGVELRTDKGANNLHLILIFSEKSNLETLSYDFDALMIRGSAKSGNSSETIYWDFNDIVEFANKHDALISIHAGQKTNGIDKEIKNALPVKEAIKSDIADAVHFFEIGQKRDIDDYEKHVFKDIERKPLIICSDNHSPKEYTVKERLWIKADLTFDGLKQCVYQPKERVYIGEIPPTLDRVGKNRQNNILSISCARIETPANIDSNWFNFSIPLNPGMVAIIGNKGSGKSALSDIIGHLCRCNTMEKASFLNDTRFRKRPKNYANDYCAALTWCDGKTRSSTLAASQEDSHIEDAQYLPQKYIEDVCNEFGDVFQKEIDKVIFSYIDKTERGDARNLEELVKLKSKGLEFQFQNERIKLKNVNRQIIELEQKKTKEYRKFVSESLKNAEENLRRHEKSKPIEVKKPEQKDSDVEYQTKLSELNNDIQEKKNKIKETEDKIAKINIFLDDAKTVVAQISLLETQFKEVQVKIEALIDKYNLQKTDCVAELATPKEFLNEAIRKTEEDKKNLQNSISAEDSGFSAKLANLEKEKAELISKADVEEKLYQKYLADLAEWNEKRRTIIGDSDTDGSIEFYKEESEYIEKKLDSEYDKLVSERDGITKQIYKGITELSKIYQSIYAPVQDEITQLLGDLEDDVQFQVEVFMKDANIAQTILSFINQKYNGKYGHSHNSLQEIDLSVKNTDFGNEDSVMSFVHDKAEVIKDDFETAKKRVSKRQEFYDFVFGLEYIGVNFKLKMGGRSLEELSPGERGIVLLIFYLALSKESKPIIIDQPEDNLDNQSIYNKLVPCICKAKQKRQVIIVTHNPNIAVACDAEQIIYCKKENGINQIHYESGAIEHSTICKHVVDVLEGTMPAFDLRRLKYNSKMEEG